MAVPRSVTVKLRSGVTRAVLPDNRTMTAGNTYTISYDDWLTIASGAKASVIELVSLNTGLSSAEGIDLTTNTSSLPSYIVGGTTYYRRLGQVTPGFSGELFKLVRLVDAVDAQAGSIATWVSKSANTVTVDRVGGSSWDDFAGVFVAAVTAGNYGWIQIDGVAPTARGSGTISSGDIVQVHPTTDGNARAAEVNEVQTITITGSPTGGTFTLTFNGQTTGNIAYNANAATVQSALEALSTIGSGNVACSGGPLPGSAVTVTFQGALAKKDVSLMTATSSLTGGTSPTVTVDETQKGGHQPGQDIGTALSNLSSGTFELRIQNPARVRFRKRRLFF